MMLPALHVLKQHYPCAQFYFLTSPDGARLLSQLGYDKQRMQVYRHPFIYRWQDGAGVRAFLAKHTFDAVYCFENKARTLGWLPSHAHILPPSEKVVHYATRCLDVVEGGAQWAMQPYVSTRPEKDKELEGLLQTLGIDEHTVLIGMHPTYSGYGKWGKRAEARHRLWPWERFAMLARRLALNDARVKIIMDLLPHERALGLQIQNESPAMLLTWTPDFQRYLSLLKRLNVIITPNTGVMHLAAALNTPTVALFSKHNPNDCGPFMDAKRFKVVQAGTKPFAHLGLAALGVDDVWAATQELMTGVDKR